MKISRSVRSDININVETNEGNNGGHGPKGKECHKDYGHQEHPVEDMTTMSPDKQEACDLIKQAIDKLSTSAETDDIARDSIANLVVVLLSLKG